MFIGRVRGWPVAREGAQKLKEISYVHAEAYPAAELKHGPLALISPEHADGRDRPRRRPAREEPLDAGGDQGAQRPVMAVAHRELPPELADRTVIVPRNEPELDPILHVRSRCSCWPTTRPWRWAGTSTSPATWPRA